MIRVISDLHISDLRFSAPSSIKCAFYFYSMPGGYLKWRKNEEKAMDDGWPGGWAMMNDGSAMTALYLTARHFRRWGGLSAHTRKKKL